MKSLRPFVFLLAFAALASCKKSGTENRDGTLRDYTGKLDGCTWLIELNSGDRLEPINLSDFVAHPSDGMKVRISYEAATNSASICMAGELVKLLSLKAR